jgi:sRNA-binding protein
MAVMKRLNGLDRKPLTLPKPGAKKVERGTGFLELPKPGVNPKQKDIERGTGLLAKDKPTPSLLSPSGTVPDRGATVLGMPVNKFAQLAGAMGSSFAPDTPMGKIGAFTSNLASQNIAEDKAAKTKADDRATTLEDRNTAKTYAKTLRDENRTYTERRDQTLYDRGADARDLAKRSAEKTLSRMSAQVYYGPDGSSFKTNTPEEVAQAKALGMSKVKPGNKVKSGSGDNKRTYVKILEDGRWNNQSNIDDEGQVKDSLVQIQEAFTQGNAIALKQYPEVAKQAGILPKGDWQVTQRNDTEELVFWDAKSGGIRDMYGKVVKLPKKEPDTLQSH